MNGEHEPRLDAMPFLEIDVGAVEKAQGVQARRGAAKFRDPPRAGIIYCARNMVWTLYKSFAAVSFPADVNALRRHTCSNQLLSLLL